MKNVEIMVDAKKKTLTIEIDLSKRHGLSESGKTFIIASTEGSQKIGFEDIVLGLNCYVKNPDYDPEEAKKKSKEK